MSFSPADYMRVLEANHQDRIEASRAVFDAAVNEADSRVGGFLRRADSDFELSRRLDIVGDELERVAIAMLDSEDMYPIRQALKLRVLAEITPNGDEGVSADPFGFALYEQFCKQTGLDPSSWETYEAFRKEYGSSVDVDFDALETWIKAQIDAHRTASYFVKSFIGTNLRIASQQWLFDDFQKAYVSKTHRNFTCSCGHELKVPSYSTCKCGRIWNSYSISSEGKTMFVAREIPVRKDVVIA